MLIRIVYWRAVVGALIAIAIFSGLSVPFTPIRIPGLGVLFMKRLGSLSTVLLTLGWFVYGVVLLGLPFLFHEQRGIFHGPAGAAYSSFLPRNCVDWLATFLSSRPYAPAWVLVIISMVAVVILGVILSLSLLSWYFAVSLAFQGHNNEAGGAARIEKFKHIVRLRLRKDDLTAYVIGIDLPRADGYKSEPKLIDVFTLRVT